jgi:hypothetical protein
MKLCTEILKRAKAVEEKIKAKLAVSRMVVHYQLFLTTGSQLVPGKISFTFDTWTLETGSPFLSVTGHYIQAAQDNPNQWRLCN